MSQDSAASATRWIKENVGALGKAARAAGHEPAAVTGAGWLAAFEAFAGGAEPSETTTHRIIRSVLYTQRDAEPVQRGHRGHSYAVSFDDCAEPGFDDSPESWLEAREAVTTAAASGDWHAQALADALAGRVEPRAAHRVASARTQRRHRQHAREAGQQGFAGFGWG